MQLFQRLLLVVLASTLSRDVNIMLIEEQRDILYNSECIVKKIIQETKNSVMICESHLFDLHHHQGNTQKKVKFQTPRIFDVI